MVSLRLYPHDGLDAPEIVAEAPGAGRAGGGCRVRRCHDERASRRVPRLPAQPAASPQGWCLDAMDHGLGRRPCPLLLPLRETALVAEDVAWLDARFPGRRRGRRQRPVRARGGLRDRPPVDGRAHRPVRRAADGSWPGSCPVARLGPVRNVPAVRAFEARPIPLVSAAMGFTATAARSRARHRPAVRLAVDARARRRRSSDRWYRAEGGTARVRRESGAAWIGEPPREDVDRQVDRYRYRTRRAPHRPSGEVAEPIASTDGREVAEQLRGHAGKARAPEHDREVNLRVRVPGVSPAAAARPDRRVWARPWSPHLPRHPDLIPLGTLQPVRRA